jgi:serine/threonine protein kinase
LRLPCPIVSLSPVSFFPSVRHTHSILEFRGGSFGSLAESLRARLQEHQEIAARRASNKSKRKAERKLAGKPDPRKSNILDKPKPTRKLADFFRSVEEEYTLEPDVIAADPSHPSPHHILHLGPDFNQGVIRLSGFNARLSAVSEHSQEYRNVVGLQGLLAMDASRLAPAARTQLDQQDKARRVKDAQEMFATITRNAERSGTQPPPYEFLELIGKGTFGRVYKCRDEETGDLVAIKIVNIDEQDWSEGFSHRDSRDSTIKDFKKEVSILRQLKDNNAKNVNVIHDAFDWHSQLWIVADYCTGGSIRTLLRPFEKNGKPMGIPEPFIIPIARELAVAIKSMHDLHIIHRDIKCANVYITEDGEIQLGDFGIVGVIDHNNSKRKTVIGTPHWMPREIVEHLDKPSTAEGYGSEVDIWSYGCTIFEMATGVPPYSNKQVHLLPAMLEESPPRLEGDEFSEGLRDFVAFCLNPDKGARPTADAIIDHHYIRDTSETYPTSSLIRLIEKFKIWEHGGGSRASLWMAGPNDPRVREDDDEDGGAIDEEFEDWNFSTSDSFDREFGRRLSQLPPGALDSWQYEAPHGAGLPPLQAQNMSVAERIKREHEELSANRGEKYLARLYDINDPSGYQLITPVEPAPVVEEPLPSDLPLRTFTSDAPTRESMIEIDLDEVNATATSTFAMHMHAINEDTVRPVGRHSQEDDDDEEDDDFHFDSLANGEKRATMEWSFATAAPKKNRATLEWTFPKPDTVPAPLATSQPKPKRGTMDWTFEAAEPAPLEDDPPMAPTSSFGSDMSPRGGPSISHVPTQSNSDFRDFAAGNTIRAVSPNRDSVRSMIDLDVGLADSVAERFLVGNDITRPSTASSHRTDATSGNPFDLEDSPEQRDADRNRFSYHKQYRSEGGMPNRLSHRSVQMHARGNSLSSTEAELEPSRTINNNYGDFPDPLQPLGMTISSLEQGLGLTPVDNHSNHQWPSFGSYEGFVDSPQYLATSSDANIPRMGDPSFPLERSLRSNGLSFSSRSRDRSGDGSRLEVDFPIMQPPHLDAMNEHPDDRTLEAEFARLLDDCAFGLSSVSRVLRHYAGIEDDEDEIGLGLGLDNHRDEVDHDAADMLTARRKPHKKDQRSSPRLPPAEGF